MAIMSEAEINERARQTFVEDAKHRERFNKGLEAAPGVPFVDRTPLTPEKIRQLANNLRAKQGLGPLEG